MVLCAKVPKENAERLRVFLMQDDCLDLDYSVMREEEFVYFALKGKKLPAISKYKAKIVEHDLISRQRHPNSLYDALVEKFSEGELEKLVSSFDILGDIAIIEVPPELQKREKEIGEAILRVHGNVKVVAKKTGATSGEFRIRPVKVVCGDGRTSTVYRESGCEFELDVNKVYFSSRLGTERSRIANLVQEKENVLVLFAGIGPFAIVIAKRKPNAKVIAIELNPDAIGYMKRNIERNKCANVTAVLGDVRKVLAKKEYAASADRVVMPLPKDASKFLECVFPTCKKGAIVHLYSFDSSEKPFVETERQVGEEAKKAGRKIEVINRRIVRPYSPDTVQVVVDFKVL